MNDLKNLTLWFSFGPDGEIDKLVNLKAHEPNAHLLAEFEKMSLPSEHRVANVYTFTTEWIKTPAHIFDAEGEGVIMHYNGERLRAILPWFITIGDMK